MWLPVNGGPLPFFVARQLDPEEKPEGFLERLVADSQRFYTAPRRQPSLRSDVEIASILDVDPTSKSTMSFRRRYTMSEQRHYPTLAQRRKTKTSLHDLRE